MNAGLDWKLIFKVFSFVNHEFLEEPRFGKHFVDSTPQILLRAGYHHHLVIPRMQLGFFSG